MKTDNQAERITPADIRIDVGIWEPGGGRYRAAVVRGTACPLTGPEHADLSDAALLREAVAEAKRAGILRRKNPNAMRLGRIGGLTRSAAQTAARRANGAKGGRPRTRPRCAACTAAGARCRHPQS